MSEVVKRLREVIYRLKLYMLGIRFYKRELNTESPIVFEVTYHIANQFTVHFQFNRMACMDLVLRRGYLVGESYSSYEVMAVFKGNVPKSLDELNGQKFFFNGMVNNFGKEDQTLELIADVYLDFIKTRVVNIA